MKNMFLKMNKMLLISIYLSIHFLSELATEESFIPRYRPKERLTRVADSGIIFGQGLGYINCESKQGDIQLTKYEVN